MTSGEELGFLILGIQREGDRFFTSLLLPLGITTPQAEIFSCLWAKGRLSLNDLGKLLVCETSSPSRLVDGMIRRGIVLRREDTAGLRRATLVLTPTGEQLANDVSKLRLNSTIGLANGSTALP